MLSQLSEDQYVQDCLKENPDVIIGYINNFLRASLNEEVMFVVIMILDNMVTTGSKKNLWKYAGLKDGLIKVGSVTNNDEMRLLIKKVLNKIENREDFQVTKTSSASKSLFDKAMDNLCDPLLPVRGHALLELTKLIESKNTEAMEKSNICLICFRFEMIYF